MEGMNLAKLEAVVEKMLNNLHELRRENAALQAQVEARNNRIDDLEVQLNALNSTQEEVSSRVTNLLSSIEEWERAVDTDPQEEGEEAPEPREANLFSMAD